MNFNDLNKFANLSNTFSGNSTVTMGNVTFENNSNVRNCHSVMQIGDLTIYNIQPGQSIEFKFKKLTNDLIKNIFATYLNYISQAPRCCPRPFSLSDRLREIRRIETGIRVFQPNYNEENLTDSMVENIDLYLEVSKKLSQISCDILIDKIIDAKKFLIEHRCFDITLDDIHLNLINTFNQIFQQYYHEGNFTKAFEAASEISLTVKGAKAFLSLAKSYLLRGEPDMAVNCLNKIEVGGYDAPIIFSEEDYTSLFTEVDTNVILKILPKISVETVKMNLIDYLSNQYILNNEIYKASSLISLYKNASERGKLCGKIVDRILKDNSAIMEMRASQACKVIISIKDKYYERIEYKKVIEMFFFARDIPRTLEYIKVLNEKYYEREEYVKVIDYFLGKNDIQSAMEVIKLLKEKYYEREQLQKVIKYYTVKALFKQAAAVINLFKENYYEKEAYETLFKVIVGQVNILRSSGHRIEANAYVKTAQDILAGISHNDTVKVLKALLFDCMDKMPVEQVIMVVSEKPKPNNISIVQKMNIEPAQKKIENKGMDVEQKKEETPAEYLCPITQDIMKNPVIASDGYTYEKDEIEKWYTNHKTSPMTREELTGVFIKNRALIDGIKKWQNK